MVSWGGRHLESENIGRIDVPRSIRARRLEKGAVSTAPDPGVSKGVRGFGPARLPPAENAGTVSSQCAKAPHQRARRPATGPQAQRERRMTRSR